MCFGDPGPTAGQLLEAPLLGFRVLGFRALKIEGLGFFKGVGLFWA